VTELISPRESAYLFTAVSVLIVLVLLLVFQTYRSRQISRAMMNGIIGAIVTGVVVVALIFLEYSVPYSSQTKYVPRRKRKRSTEHIGERERAVKTTLPRNYVCYRAERPPVIDGNMADSAWQEVPWTEYFADIRGEDAAPPRLRTRVKMLWDDTHFYVGAEMQEPHVWATLDEKNSIVFNDNDFEVFIDPDGDNHNYYEFEINALNTIWELTLVKPYRDGGPPMHGTNMKGLRSAVDVAGTLNNPANTDRGWSVEIAFPWEGFRRYTKGDLPPRGGQWRVNFSRVEWQHRVVDGRYEKEPDTQEDNWAWSPQGVTDMHRPENWGYVQFSTAGARADTFRPDPTGSLRKLLIALYYKQKAFHEENKRWAASLEELELGADFNSGRARVAAMSSGKGGFKATGVIVRYDGNVLTVHVNQESKLWLE
jgi:hypothetical protein